MDVLAFISHIFASAVWPLTVLTAIFLFREPIAGILRAIRKVKWGDLEAEFGKNLERARELIDQIPQIDLAPVTSERFPEKNKDLLLKLAELSPRYVVLEAWREVEAAATNALRRLGQGTNRSLSPSSGIAGKLLLDAKLIDDAEFQVFSILRDLRNRAAHERYFDLAKDEALEYATLAQRTAGALDALSQSKGTT